MPTAVSIEPWPSVEYADIESKRDLGFRHFASIMAGDQRLRGRVLDIGCGDGNPHSEFARVIGLPQRLDGVEPSSDIDRNARVQSRWKSTLEDAPIPAGVYDAAVAFFVLEHVSQPGRFMEAVVRALRPGGVFYAVTPNSRHPFCIATRLLDVLGIKKHLGTETYGVNTYASYYRLNSASALARAIGESAVSSARAHYYPCVQWDTYFPPGTRAVPRLYERTLGMHVSGMAQLVMFKVEK